LFALYLIQCAPSPNENPGAPQNSNAHTIKNKLNINKISPPGATASNYVFKKNQKEIRRGKLAPLASLFWISPQKPSKAFQTLPFGIFR
jgi:hypothetical protein